MSEVASAQQPSITQPTNPAAFQSPAQYQRARLTRSSTSSPAMSPLTQSQNQPHRVMRSSLAATVGKVHTALAPATRLVIPSPGPAVPWKRTRLTSTSRCAETGKSMNDLMIYHWTRAQTTQPTNPSVHHALAAQVNQGDYRFAKFNKSIRLIKYTDREYYQFLQSQHWTKEETDHLMYLCEMYDLRFIVIYDRYSQWIDEQQSSLHDQPIPQHSPSTDESQNHAATDQSTNQSTNQSTDQSTNQSSNQSPDQSTDQSTNQPTNQSSSQSSNQLSNQSTNQSRLSDTPLITITTISPTSSQDQSQSSQAISSTSSSSPSRQFQSRTVEQLKSRFYSIQTLLLTSRNSSDPDLVKHPLLISSYDETYETGRKAALAELFKRTHTQVEEMAMLTLEHRRIGTTIKQLKQNARAAIAGPGRKRGRGMQSGASIPEHLLAPIPDVCVPPVTLTGQAALSNQPVFLRSAQLGHTWKLAPKEIKTLENELNALSIKKAKDVIPTGPVVELYDKLRIELLTLHNLSKYIGEREAMLADLRKELANVQARAAASQAAGQVMAQVDREEKVDKIEPLSPDSTHRDRDRDRERKKEKKKHKGEKLGGDIDRKKEKRKAESDKDKRDLKKRKEI